MMERRWFFLNVWMNILFCIENSAYPGRAPCVKGGVRVIACACDSPTYSLRLRSPPPPLPSFRRSCIRSADWLEFEVTLCLDWLFTTANPEWAGMCRRQRRTCWVLSKTKQKTHFVQLTFANSLRGGEGIGVGRGGGGGGGVRVWG